MLKADLIKFLNSKKIIFWDFDGVIKDSNEAKNIAFLSVIKTKDLKIKNKIIKHHKKNLGLSRYKKIPLYLSWIKINYKKDELDQIYKRLSKILIRSVIACKWIKGTYSFIKKNYKKKIFVLISATPQKELEIILQKIGIYKNFIEIYGYPHKKKNVIENVLTKNKFKRAESVFIGDSMNDYLAAKKAKVPFLLKKNNDNIKLTKTKGVLFFNHFNE